MTKLTHGDSHVTDRSEWAYGSPTLFHMSAIPASRSIRSADVVNEQIRDLWVRTGGRLNPEDRAEYESLVTEWASAIGSGVAQHA